MRMINGLSDLNELVLFSFDNLAFPFSRGVQLKLISYPTKLDSRSKVVVPLGEKGKHDSGHIAYYGTVLKVKNEYWMWYLGADDSSQPLQRLCFAVSKDGKEWEKPNLGLCEFNGNKNNNLCEFPIDAHVQACVVFYDPDEPDKSKTFKLSFESPKYNKCMGVAFSPDGIHWTEYPNNPVGDIFYEQGGGMKKNGTYYVTGQGSTDHYTPKGARSLATYCSTDFIHWTPAACVGFRRDAVPPRTTEYGGTNGPQVHLGAGLWDRGNVILGFYGMWNGHVSCDRNMVYMHLGLVISHDGLYYHEPIPDFPIVLSGEMKNDTSNRGRFPALMQGQGVENIDDETFFWFGLWPEADSNGVRVARWGRDRLGYLTSFVGPKKETMIISNEIITDNKPVRVSLNVNGLNEYSKLRVTVLDKNFKALPGYSTDDCPEIDGNGFKVPVCWKNRFAIQSPDPIRLRIDYQGIRPEDIELYAVYLEY